MFGNRSSSTEFDDLREQLKQIGLQLNPVEHFTAAKTPQDQVIAAMGYHDLVSEALDSGQSATQAHNKAIVTMKQPGWLDSQRARLGLPPRAQVIQVTANPNFSASASNEQASVIANELGGLPANVQILLANNPGILAAIASALPTMNDEQKQLLKQALQTSTNKKKLEKVLGKFGIKPVEASKQSAGNRKR